MGTSEFSGLGGGVGEKLEKGEDPLLLKSFPRCPCTCRTLAWWVPCSGAEPAVETDECSPRGRGGGAGRRELCRAEAGAASWGQERVTQVLGKQ